MLNSQCYFIEFFGAQKSLEKMCLNKYYNNNTYNWHHLTWQELSPTTDTNLVKSLMNLIDCQMDEFQDEAKIAQMEEQEVIAWLEVYDLPSFPI